MSKSNILKRLIVMILVICMLTNITNVTSISNNIENQEDYSISIDETTEIENSSDENNPDEIKITEESIDNDETIQNSEELNEIKEENIEISQNDTNIEIEQEDLEQDNINFDEDLIIEEETLNKENQDGFIQTENQYEATYGEHTGTLSEIWNIAIQANDTSKLLNINQNVVISEQLELLENQNVTINLNGYEISLSENAPIGKDRIFYVNGGNLKIITSSDNAILKGGNCSGDGGIIYLKEGTVDANGIDYYCRNSNGKGKAIYIEENTTFNFGGQSFFEEIQLLSDGTEEFVEDSKNDLIYINGSVILNGIWEFNHGGYVMVSDKAPADGAIDLICNFCGYPNQIPIKAESYPKTIVKGIPQSFPTFFSYDILYKCIINDNQIDMIFAEEAKYGESIGTLKEMIELSFQDENPGTVELLRDVEINYQINISNKNLRLNMKNHKLKRINNDEIENGRIFLITENGKLELVDGYLEGGKSTANGGAIYVGKGSTLWLANIKKMSNNIAQKGSAIYVEDDAIISIRYNTNIYGNGINDSVIYSNSKIQIWYDVNIENGTIVVNNNGSTQQMFEFVSASDGTKDVIDTVTPLNIKTVLTPVILTNELKHAMLLIPDLDYQIVNINGNAVLIKVGKNEASYTSNNGDVINGSLKEMWNLAKFYGSGTVTLQTNLTANTSYSVQKPSKTEWEEGFYQMVTGQNANIIFDFNGHTLDANMNTLIDENNSVKAGTNFLFLINDKSTLTLTDSVGGGGVKNIISGSEYPALAYISGTTEASHLVIDNISITNCYSGKGIIYSNNFSNDVIIKNNVIIKDNKKIIEDTLISSSLSDENINIYIDENLNIISEGLGENAEIGINGDEAYFDKLIKLNTKEFSDSFISDNKLYATITHNGYVVFTEIERMNEVKYTDENGNERITSFSDAFSRVQYFGGNILLLKDISPKYSTYTYESEKEITIELNGNTITAIGNNAENFITINKGIINILEKNKADKITAKIDYLKNTNYSFENKILTYYTSYDNQTSEFRDETTIHKDDLNNLGGIKTIGYNGASISVTDGSNAKLKINGGFYISDKSVFYLKYGDIKNAYIIDSGNNSQDNIIYTRGFVTFENSVIVGNKSSNGIIFNSGILNIKKSIISNNETENSGTINNEIVGELKLDNMYICYNSAKEGGAIYINNNSFTDGKKIEINNTYMTNNIADSGGAIYVNPYYEKLDNLDSIKLIRNIDINDSYIIANEAKNGEGGGFFIQSTTETSLINNCKFYKNKASKNGGGIYLYDTKINIKNTDLKYNSAQQNGGGIYYDGNTFIDIGEAWLENVNINNNASEKGSGLYCGLLRMHLMGNIDMTNNKDTGLYVLKNMSVGVNYLESGKIPFKTTDIPTREHNVIFATSYNDEKISEIFNKKIFIHEEYEIISENTGLYLKANINAEFNGVLVQYYSYLDDIANDRKSIQTNEDEKDIVDLSIIDTSCDYNGIPLDKPSVPHNGFTDKMVGWKYIWLVPLNDGKNSVEIRRNKILRMIFEDTDVNPDNIEKMSDINRFTKHNEHYDVKEVWVLKGDDFTSIKPEDWEIHSWNPDEKFEYPRGTVVRLVCEQTIDETYENDVIFYDYDITDGKFYTDSTYTNWLPSSKSEEYLRNNPNKNIYVKTEACGINDLLNYKNDGGAKFAFGNANTATKWKDEIWTSPLNNKVNLNKANTGTVGGCSFRLINHVDEKGNLVWENGVDAPYIYDGGDAIGKTTYVDKKLVFTRRGDTYTFTGVKGLNQEMTDLDKFKFTSYNWNKTKKLYSNNFWPMDYVESFGSDGHDVKLGYGNDSTPEHDSFVNRIRTSQDQGMPKSDDSLPHNFYFGMQFSMSFELPEEYNGPLEYWFFGDDEMYIFLDGELVCDIGGVHASIGQYINLWSYIEKGDTSKHTLSFYYTERGASGSTCWMQFTAPNVYSDTQIPVNSAYEFIKVNQHDNIVTGAEFTLFLEDGTEVKKSLSDENGKVKFDNLNKNTKYIIKETKTSTEDYVLSKNIYLLEWIDTEWIMYLQDDTSKTKVTTVVNYVNSAELPETGSNDAIYIRNMTIMIAFLGCFIFILAILYHKRER